jgi:hypothetical protein
MKRVCPLQCRRRHDGERAAPTHIEWAGLPINLDLAFSREQRDKVYVQHLMRKQGSQLWRWLQPGAQLCACDDAADDGHVDLGAAESVPSH